MPVKTLAGAVFVIAISFIWLPGVFEQAEINDDITLTDQDAYINFAIDVHDSGFTYTGSRNRMPLYPFIQAFFCHKRLSTSEFFECGKLVNVGITIIVLVTVFVVLAFFVPLYNALLVTLIAAFTVFAYKAPYFQADVLYYGLSFLLFFVWNP